MDKIIKEPKILKTDTNFTKLPIFSTSKNEKLEKSTTEEIVYYNNNNKTTTLNIQYNGTRKPTFFDRRILSILEYAFVEKYEMRFKDFTNQVKEEINNLMIEKYSPNLPEEISPAEKQVLIYKSCKNVSGRYSIDIDLKTINSLLYTDSKTIAKTKINESIKILNNTKILVNTTYKLYNTDSDKLETETNVPILDYISIGKKNNKFSKKEYSIFFNPFHFYNIINGEFTYLDLNLLNSFHSQSAGRLYEFIKPKLYKPIKSKRDKIVLSYEVIASQLRLKKHTKLSYIKQQLKKPLDELIEKGVIYEYSFETTLLGIDIHFKNNLDFFENYFNQLPLKERNKLSRYYDTLSNESKEKLEIEALSFLQINEGFKKHSALKQELITEEYILYQLSEKGIKE